MSQIIRYESVSTVSSWYEDLHTVRRDSVSWTHRADQGEVGSSEFIVEDETGTAGHGSDAIVAFKTIRVYETDAGTDNENILTGFVGPRRYERGITNALIVGAAREIHVTVQDINAAASFEIFHDGDGDRPSETVDARVAWLLGSGYIDCVDNGLVESSSVVLDANPYDGQKPADVLTDCGLKAGFNWFLYWDPALAQISLAFMDSNTSTAYSSDMRISNVSADVDSDTEYGVGGTQTWGPFFDAVLERNPEHTFSGVYVTYDGGAVYRRNTATGSNYAWRDGSAPTASVKTSGAAIALADQELAFASAETDALSATIFVPKENVNDIRAGQRLQVKFSHLPGYETWRWCRVLTKTVRQEDRPDLYYIDLLLSPQCVGTGGITNFGALSKIPETSLYAFPFTPTAGSLLVVCSTRRSGASPATISGWTSVEVVGPAVVFGSMAAYATDSDGTETSIDLVDDATTHGYVYEFAGAAVADIVDSDQNYGNADTWTCDSVTLGGTGAVIGFFALMMDQGPGGGGWHYTLDADGDSFDVREDEVNFTNGPYIVLTRLAADAGTFAPEITVVRDVALPWTTEPPFWYGVAIAVSGTSGTSCG
jgi:hypothetical protein